MQALITPENAASILSKNMPLQVVERCLLLECVGRVLREPIRADRPFPPFDRSMMDGYALRVTDARVSPEFQVVGQVPAGAPAMKLGQGSGHCLEIMTGAVVPSDADCVVPYEATEVLPNGRVRLLHPNEISRGECIHYTGSDTPKDKILLEPGRVLGSRHLAAAATCGYTQLSVSRRPSIALVTTGDELVTVDQVPGPHQIRRSNDVSIEAVLAQRQLKTLVRAHLNDDLESTRDSLSQLIDTHDCLLITGGISMGKRDFIPAILDELGLHCHFHGVAQKPGKPFGFWTGSQCSVFALPGNPLSTLTCLHHYVLPAINQAMGGSPMEAGYSVSLTESTPARDDLTLFLPVKLSPGGAIPCPAENSGDLVRILESDGYLQLPPTPEKVYRKEDPPFIFHAWL